MPKAKPQPNVPAPMRSSLLAEVDGLIHGERQSQYGSWEQNFQDIADIWNMQLRHKLITPVDPYDVANMMVAVKVARNANIAKHDNLADGAGYLAIAAALEHTIIAPPPPRVVDPTERSKGSRRRTR